MGELTVPDISSWSEWKPKDYLRDYYHTIEPDEVETIAYLSRVFSRVRGNPLMIEFGCGPTLHHVIPAAERVSEIHMADYLEVNLDEIANWVGRGIGRHNWQSFTRYTLECEGQIQPSEDAVRTREDLVRGKISKLVQGDASLVDPIGHEYRGFYPLVMSCYCADSATSDRVTWEAYLRHIASLTQPGGLFITAALRKAAYYRVGERFFPSADIDEYNLRQVLEIDFCPASINIEVRELPEHQEQGYQGIVLAHALRRT